MLPGWNHSLRIPIRHGVQLVQGIRHHVAHHHAAEPVPGIVNVHRHHIPDMMCCAMILMISALSTSNIRLNIKCPRCGTLNHLSAKSAATERHGASNKKESLREQVPDP